MPDNKSAITIRTAPEWPLQADDLKPLVTCKYWATTTPFFSIPCQKHTIRNFKSNLSILDPLQVLHFSSYRCIIREMAEGRIEGSRESEWGVWKRVLGLPMTSANAVCVRNWGEVVVETDMINSVGEKLGQQRKKGNNWMSKLKRNRRGGAWGIYGKM
jgi:hypothetical protein